MPSRALAGACLVLLGCSGTPAPAGPPEPPAPALVAAAAPAPSASSSAVWAEAEASAEAAPEPQPEPPASTDDENGPEIDCKTIKAARAPSRRSLCEAAMAMNTGEIVDYKGFSYVARFESPADGADAAEGNMKKRVCAKDAHERVRHLLRTIRYKLAQGDDSDPWVFCKGMTCQIRGEGEWSTWGTLYFRRSGDKVVLEAWTEIELALVPEDEARQRKAFLASGLRALAGARCTP